MRVREVILDCALVESREDLHRYLAHALCFPDWYCGTLYALHDCLADLEGEVTIRLLHLDFLRVSLGEYAGRFLRTLRHAEAVTPGLTVTVE